MNGPASYRAVRSVRCPTCGASPGNHCADWVTGDGDGWARVRVCPEPHPQRVFAFSDARDKGARLLQILAIAAILLLGTLGMAICAHRLPAAMQAAGIASPVPEVVR